MPQPTDFTNNKFLLENNRDFIICKIINKAKKLATTQ